MTYSVLSAMLNQTQLNCMSYTRDAL